MRGLKRRGEPLYFWPMLDKPKFIAGEIYRNSTYGGKHPLAIPRVSVALDMVRALGWVDDTNYIDSPVATAEQIARFHTPEYIDAVQRAQRDGDLPEAEKDRFGLGRNGNPIYREVFTRPATSAGGSILAGKLLKDGGIVHSVASGTHHGLKDRANGFCFFNDPVLGIYSLLDQGLESIYYVDIDVHHGDGVEIAFADDPRVFTLSVHQDGIWPGTGKVSDIAGGHARNLPIPAGMHDAEMAAILGEVILPIGEALSPDAVVIQTGCDTLADDPLGRQNLSNGAIWNVAKAVSSLSPRTLVLGGGGYNPYAVGRCWAGIWGVLNDYAIPEQLPETAQHNLRAISWSHRMGKNPPDHWFETLQDPPNLQTIRPEVWDIIQKIRGFGI